MRLSIALAFALTAMPALAGPASEVVRPFYETPGAEREPEYRDRFVDPAKSVFDANDKATELCLDFVISIDAQDWDEAELKRTLKLEEEIVGEDATVTASFTLFPGGGADSERIIIWTLKQVDGQWKVSDVMSDGSNWRLGEFDCSAE